MSPNGKWLEGLAPDADVALAARQALGERLAAVQYWLPPAAYCSDMDIEHIHRLRVSTRRAMAAWRLFELWLPPKSAQRVRKWLQKIRRAAGDARDLDVLHERVAREFGADGRPIADHIAALRQKVQPRLVGVADRARRKSRFARDVERFISGIKLCCNKRACDECAPFQKWAQRRLKNLSETFFEELPEADPSPSELHQFRIRSKELRYALELVAPVLGGDLRDVHYPVIEELQERLGSINDHATAAERFEHWAAEEKSGGIHRDFAALAESERQRLASETREFHNWWTPERAEALRAGLLPPKDSSRDRTVLAY
jgi:CHAD domain-containing protein